MSGPDIRFDDVGLELSGVRILSQISFRIAAGEIHCLIGPNGGGKTSVVRCLLGQMPHTGRITIDSGSDAVIGYVPQILDFDRTLPVTVSDFMALVCQKRRPAFLGMPKTIKAQAADVLSRVEFDLKKCGTRLGSLSGGERQRVLFAQALQPKPDLLILDEPMTSLDEVGIQVLLRLIGQLADDGTTIVWIAHELDHVRAMADAVTCIAGSVLFSGKPGDVLADHSADVLFRRSEVPA